jgi:hypothetical protein
MNMETAGTVKRQVLIEASSRVLSKSKEIVSYITAVFGMPDSTEPNKPQPVTPNPIAQIEDDLDEIYGNLNYIATTLKEQLSRLK